MDMQLQFEFMDLEQNLKEIEQYAKTYAKGSTQRAIFARLGEIKRLLKAKEEDINRIEELTIYTAVLEDVISSYSQKIDAMHYEECLLLREANG